MAGVEHRDFSAPDETRTPDKTTVELVNLAGGQIGRDLHPLVGGARMQYRRAGLCEGQAVGIEAPTGGVLA